mgnify:CR=1 FL=1|tara:strand:- start:663 stop:1022 length:360 start_codon:yes stop_codon:yes gene_type:complete
MSLLKESGLNFDKHLSDGIPQSLFAEYLITSGLALNKRNHWITFHGGMDFGYLYKYLSGQVLPSNQDLFVAELKLYFANYYDCKELMREIVGLNGGLTKVAQKFDIDRIGTMHQAGSDA